MMIIPRKHSPPLRPFAQLGGPEKCWAIMLLIHFFCPQDRDRGSNAQGIMLVGGVCRLGSLLAPSLPPRFLGHTTATVALSWCCCCWLWVMMPVALWLKLAQLTRFMLLVVVALPRTMMPRQRQRKRGTVQIRYVPLSHPGRRAFA